jgi:hypothetical protein
MVLYKPAAADTLCFSSNQSIKLIYCAYRPKTETFIRSNLIHIRRQFRWLSIFPLLLAQKFRQSIINIIYYLYDRQRLIF